MKDPFAALAAQLTARAAALAAARLRERSTPPERRWRSAALLWPLFTKG